MGIRSEVYNLLGFRGMGTARIVFGNVEVPDEYRLGGVNNARVMVAEAVTKFDAARSLVYTAARAADLYDARVGSDPRRFG